jgi:plasmid stabilization system protein ParE
MRNVRISRTARDMFLNLLDQGLAKFGTDVTEQKRWLVLTCIGQFLTHFPHLGLRTPRKSFYHYPVSGTPFTVIYEYDEVELRVLFIVHNSTNRRRLKATDVEW